MDINKFKTKEEYVAQMNTESFHAMWRESIFLECEREFSESLAAHAKIKTPGSHGIRVFRLGFDYKLFSRSVFDFVNIDISRACSSSTEITDIYITGGTE